MSTSPVNARLAHLFCELYVRLKAVGLAYNGEFDVPLTQTQLADVVGMTPVHVNRTLAVLLKARFIETNARRVQICDFAKLADLGGFEPSYLHPSETKPSATV